MFYVDPPGSSTWWILCMAVMTMMMMIGITMIIAVGMPTSMDIAVGMTTCP